MLVCNEPEIRESLGVDIREDKHGVVHTTVAAKFMDEEFVFEGVGYPAKVLEDFNNAIIEKVINREIEQMKKLKEQEEEEEPPATLGEQLATSPE